MRIVSLIASSTEIVCALGQGAALVGRSHECDFPADVKRLPVCTSPKIDVDASSREIDAAVKRLVKDAVSVYRVDSELLQRLAPDVIITQTQCEVCAVSLKDVEEALQRTLGVKAEVVSLQPNRLSDVHEDIRRVARALGVAAEGERLIRSMEQRMESVRAKAAKLPKPRAACIEWLDPPMAAGNWVPELVERAGGVNVFGEAGKHSPWLDFDALTKADPDVIVAMPCGYDIARTRKEMPALATRSGFEELKAARSGRVFIADGNQFFNRPGPRLAESLEILAEILHPEQFSYGHEGSGWVQYR